MGCDIHIMTERKVGDKWVMVENISGGLWDARKRNYTRFSALAGVRGDGPAPNGLPNDISDSVALHSSDWMGDAHSHSFMSVKDAADIFLATDPNPPDWAKDDPAEYYFNIGKDVDMHRIVFWFDN